MKDIVKLIHQLSYGHSKHKVFSDFVEMSAIAISNAVDKLQYDEREKRYLEIVGQYKKEEVYEFPNLLRMLVNHMEEKPQDVLGSVFHELELHNERKGQFFTPFPICQMMAKMTIGSGHEKMIEQNGFITISEPASGTGAMVIAAAQELHTQGVNYQQHMHVLAVDLDLTCVHAAYVQFSLLHIPAVVIHGDTLKLEEFSHWFTPAHILGFWDKKLRRRHQLGQMKQIIDFVENTKIQTHEPSPHPVNNTTPTQRPNGNGTQLKIF